MEIYICGKCGIEKPITEYHKHLGTTKGHNSICKNCKKKNRSIINELISNAKKRAIKRGFEYNLTKEYIAQLNDSQNGLCAYTGITLNWDIDPIFNKQRKCPMDRVSLDRIDSSKGYTQDNVQLVTDFMNRIKGWYPNNDIYEFCQLLMLNKK